MPSIHATVSLELNDISSILNVRGEAQAPKHFNLIRHEYGCLDRPVRKLNVKAPTQLCGIPGSLSNTFNADGHSAN